MSEKILAFQVLDRTELGVLRSLPEESGEEIGDGVLQLALEWEWVKGVLDVFGGDVAAAIQTLRAVNPVGAERLNRWAAKRGWMEIHFK